ncbi:nucleotidyltransferase family protein [Salsipaludibacter albus]|uniref:nucleotidyltransferase family protein n=1 Tax=Salsipaludibacter albus TaxID=2849650 RepID=UPI001EE4DA2A|nr:nucleotidyltransferase family protein [Salsipaludibacter albus]MBY5163052.1 nucleotidyltransferase family protein [Salsipaludibacter albus]
MTTADALGVVLAAGAGTRFGATKQLAEVAGRPLVRHAVDLIAAAGLDVLVVVGHEATRVAAALPDEVAGRTVRTVVNPEPARGQGSSLAVAAAAAGRRPLVVVLGDQPGVVPDDVARVLVALGEGAVAARIVHDDGPGHPVGLSGSLHDDLLALRSDRAGRDLLDRLEVVALPAGHARPVDVDTPADLDRATDDLGDGT